MTIHISIHGNGKPLVLFHGWGFDSHVWEPLIPYMVRNYQIFLVDLPGFGLSSFMEWDDFKYELLNKLPLHFSLLGWSMGGLFATRMAIEESLRVTQLLNVSSSPRFIKDSSWPGVDKEIFIEFYENLIDNPYKTQQKFIKLQLQGQVKKLDFPNPLATPIALSSGLNVLLEWDLRKLLPAYKNPVCCMFGQLDSIISRKTLIIMQTDYPNFIIFYFLKRHICLFYPIHNNLCLN